jgi:hypothetical protein
MRSQMRLVILAAEAGKGVAAPVKMTDKTVQKFVAGTDRQGQRRGRSQEGDEDQSATEHDGLSNSWLKLRRP